MHGLKFCRRKKNCRRRKKSWPRKIFLIQLRILSQQKFTECTPAHMQTEPDACSKREMQEEEEVDEDPEVFAARLLAKKRKALTETAERFTRRRIDTGIDAAKSVLNTVPCAVEERTEEANPFIPASQLPSSPVLSVQSKLKMAVTEGQLHMQK